MTESQDIAQLIEVKVSTANLKDHIPQEKGKFAFSYHITILNHSNETVQLLNRYWLITDGDGKISEISGRGVVGQTPVLQPGQQFSYTSGAILDTPVGFMQGHYEFQKQDKSLFNATIDVFTLSVPNLVN